MADSLTVSQTARELATSRQSILNFLRDGTLRGEKNSSGVWQIRRRSVEDFLAQYGPLNGGRRRKSEALSLQEENRELRGRVDEITTLAGDGHAVARLLAERDELRAQVAALEESLATLREASELRQQADAERARVIAELVSALGAAERVDGLQREALAVLEDGLAANLMPSRLGPTTR